MVRYNINTENDERAKMSVVKQKPKGHLLVSITREQKAEIQAAAQHCGVKSMGAYLLMRGLEAARAEMGKS